MVYHHRRARTRRDDAQVAMANRCPETGRAG